MALSFPPDRVTGPAPAPSPESIAKLDKVVEFCEGMVARYSEDFEPVWDLAISPRAAHRFLATKVDAHGCIIITGFKRP